MDLEEQMERLQAEIKELSYGLKGKREDAAKLGQRKVWDSYEDVSPRFGLTCDHTDSLLFPSSLRKDSWSCPTLLMSSLT